MHYTVHCWNSTYFAFYEACVCWHKEHSYSQGRYKNSEDLSWSYSPQYFSGRKKKNIFSWLLIGEMSLRNWIFFFFGGGFIAGFLGVRWSRDGWNNIRKLQMPWPSGLTQVLCFSAVHRLIGPHITNIKTSTDLSPNTSRNSTGLSAKLSLTKKFTDKQNHISLTQKSTRIYELPLNLFICFRSSKMMQFICSLIRKRCSWYVCFNNSKTVEKIYRHFSQKKKKITRNKS